MTWVGISGEIGAGKTAFARAFAGRTGAVYVSFGDYVRQQAEQRGLALERDVLQDLGSELLAELGPGEFTRIAVEEADALDATAAVIEGVRHLTVDDSLRGLAGARGYLLVYLDTPEPIRAARLAERGEPPQELPEFEHHPTELDVHTALRTRADLVLSGKDVDPAVAELAARLEL